MMGRTYDPNLDALRDQFERAVILPPPDVETVLLFKGTDYPAGVTWEIPDGTQIIRINSTSGCLLSFTGPVAYPGSGTQTDGCFLALGRTFYYVTGKKTLWLGLKSTDIHNARVGIEGWTQLS
jgi:hypothetical protein